MEAGVAAHGWGRAWSTRSGRDIADRRRRAGAGSGGGHPGVEGVQVLAAADGPAGLALYRARRGEIRLVLLDLSLPGMGGEESSRGCGPSIRGCGSSCRRAMTRVR